MAGCYVAPVASGKSLDELRSLDQTILGEVIREGEVRLQAQLATATAADQRAMAWAGFVTTLATASVGASASLFIGKSHLLLAVIAAALAVAFSFAVFRAIDCVRPRHFDFPGNLPENWLPSEWEGGKPRDFVQARIEQARCLNNQIERNATLAKENSARLHVSIDTVAVVVLLAALIVPALGLLDFI